MTQWQEKCLAVESTDYSSLEVYKCSDIGDCFRSLHHLGSLLLIHFVHPAIQPREFHTPWFTRVVSYVKFLFNFLWWQTLFSILGSTTSASASVQAFLIASVRVCQSFCYGPRAFVCIFIILCTCILAKTGLQATALFFQLQAQMRHWVNIYWIDQVYLFKS